MIVLLTVSWSMTERGSVGGPDGFMVKGARDLAATFAQTKLPVFYYRSSYVADAARKPDTKGAIHADALPYYFDTVGVKYGAKTTAKDRAISRTISTYVATGDPNGPDLPRWSRHVASGATMMDFNEAGLISPRQAP
jgi:para-nitrobenzyl esterase